MQYEANHLNDSRDARLFGSSILPVQFFSGRRGLSEMDAERRLAYAVLADAIRCFQLYSGSQMRSRMRGFAEVQQWFFDSAQDGPFSFESVCYLLELGCSDIRGALRRWETCRRVGEAVPLRFRRSPVKRAKPLYRKSTIRRTATKLKQYSA